MVSRLIYDYGNEVHEALRSVPEARIMETVHALLDVHRQRGTIFVLCAPEDGESVGHLVRELEQGIGAGPFSFRLVRLYGASSQIVAWQNDWATEDLYVEQMRGVIHPGDAVIAISRRGDGLGVARALQSARRSGATTISIVGFDGGLIKDPADICLHVRSSRLEQIEDVQMMLAHMLCITLRRLLSQTQEQQAHPTELVPAK